MITGFDLLDETAEAWRKGKRRTPEPLCDLLLEGMALTGLRKKHMVDFFDRCGGDIALLKERLYPRIRKEDLGWLRLDRVWLGEMALAQAFGIPFNRAQAEWVADSSEEKMQTCRVRSPVEKIESLQEWEEALDVDLPRSEKGRPTANKQNKDEVLALDPLFKHLYEYREHRALAGLFSEDRTDLGSNVHQYVKQSGYIGGLDCVHSTLKFAGTRTRRSQYENPPMNNIPRGFARTPFGFKVGQAWSVLGADVVGLEYSLLGYALKSVGNDTVWREIQNKECVKTKTLEAFGSLFANIPEENKKTMAKTLNYAILYGMSPASVAKKLKLPESRIPRIKEAIERRFPALKRLTTTLEGEVTGTRLRNLFGSPVDTIKESDGRAVVLNTYLQSSGAYYAKALFAEFLKNLRKEGPCFLFLWNHDEVQIAVPRAWDGATEPIHHAVAETYKNIKMTDGKGGPIPLIAPLDWKVGLSWAETH